MNASSLNATFHEMKTKGFMMNEQASNSTTFSKVPLVLVLDEHFQILSIANSSANSLGANDHLLTRSLPKLLDLNLAVRGTVPTDYYLTREHLIKFANFPMMRSRDRILMRLYPMAYGEGHFLAVFQEPEESFSSRGQVVSTTFQQLQSEIASIQSELNAMEQQNLAYARDLSRIYKEERRLNSQLRMTEEQLVRNDRLSSMGQVAASIAHDVNNKISALSVYVQMVQGMIQHDQDKVHRYLDKTLKGVQSCAGMLRRVLDYSRDDKFTMEPISLVNVVNRALNLVEHKLETSGITIKNELPDTPCTILGDEHQLEHVFVNLFVNAGDAMPEKGKLTVRGFEVKADPANPGAQFVLIEVEDNGTGIPKELQEKIFQPFFTTKERGKGTGLGMFIVHQIVVKHGGTLSLDSTVGKGTTFQLRFPAPPAVVQH